ncbi:hypothetical protein PT974_00349 [Cladobotryum mycophilum]|uniref:Heterokaryon incompatibility domain-containing protein n=1 Tax=Cladobotryum mycophilum TaxID=491253 RepID=A0ABR0T1T9_9HYPO
MSFWKYGLPIRMLEFHVTCPWASDFVHTIYINELSGSTWHWKRASTTSIPAHLRRIWINDRRAKHDSPRAPSIYDTQLFETIEQWLMRCKKHGLCQTANPSGFFPTRVIDVSNITNGIVSLRLKEDVLSQKGSKELAPSYFTLSHRWADPDQMFRLSRRNEKQLANGISLSELSRTFQDAMKLVSRLGYRFIWIDSLCIYQDSSLDWECEASHVYDIYHHSFCNISALLSSYNASYGLFSDDITEPFLMLPFWAMGNGPNPDLQTIMHNRDIWSDEVETAPLNMRGWVMQERFLATRIIHFGRSQVFWECLTHVRCSADPDDSISAANYFMPPVQKNTTSELSFESMAKVRVRVAREIIGTSDNYTPKSAAPRAVSRWNKIRLLWRAVTSIYSTCGLSKESDRLIALAGIATQFQQLEKSPYLAGLWKHGLHGELIWRTNACTGVDIRRDEKAAPSWSWASVCGGDGQLSFHDSWDEYPTSLIKFVDARIEPEIPEGDVLGKLRHAEIDIECQLFHFRWDGLERVLVVYCDENRMEHAFTRHGATTTVFPDTWELNCDFNQGFVEGACVPICKASNNTGGTFHILLLENVSGKRFRRLGVMEDSGVGARCVCPEHALTEITLV